MRKMIDFRALHNYFKVQPVDLVYLMGSQASGTVKPYSDIDIGVLFDPKFSSSERFNLKIAVIADLSKILGTDNIDLVDLGSANPHLAFEAIKHRKEIYSKDEKTRVHFETKVLSEYFDQQFYLSRHTILGLKNLKEEYGIRA